MDNTNINRKYLIDSLVVLHGILEYVDGYELIHNNEIIYSNYRGYIINMNLEQYFIDQLSEWNNIQKVIINPFRQSHKEKFAEILEE